MDADKKILRFRTIQNELTVLMCIGDFLGMAAEGPLDNWTVDLPEGMRLDVIQ